MWKKQRGGPPALHPATPSEVKEALASVTVEDFEGQTRAMLASLNSGRRTKDGDAGHGGDGGEGEEGSRWVSPPSSFPMEAMLQVGMLVVLLCCCW